MRVSMDVFSLRTLVSVARRSQFADDAGIKRAIKDAEDAIDFVDSIGKKKVKE